MVFTLFWIELSCRGRMHHVLTIPSHPRLCRPTNCVFLDCNNNAQLRDGGSKEDPVLRVYGADGVDGSADAVFDIDGSGCFWVRRGYEGLLSPSMMSIF